MLLIKVQYGEIFICFIRLCLQNFFCMKLGVARVMTGREGREKFKSAALKNRVANIIEESTGQ